ncbi:MAG TPA: diacylglycerol kinase family protein [Pyrinomonadaceae bacterium]|nr:diacylglycerol kinase family protein [Pyrinomonadaceae bacterium]
MRPTLVIVNHVAAKARRALPRVRALLERSGLQVDFHETTHAGDATARTRAALRDHYQTIAVLGGDGTLSEAAEGFFEFSAEAAAAPRAINPGAALAVLPAGTGDDFARGLTGKRASLDDWVRKLIVHSQSHDETHTRQVDVIYGRSNNFTLPFICLNASTLGIGGETGARVAAQGDFMRRFSGETRFLLAAAGAVAKWRERRVHIVVDNETLADEPMNLVAIANNAYAGAGMMLSPKAIIDDGKLDVVIASHLTRVNVIRELPRIHSGGHVANPKVKIKQGSYARIETFAEGDALPIEADGNVRGHTPADYRVIPAALKFVV